MHNASPVFVSCTTPYPSLCHAQRLTHLCIMYNALPCLSLISRLFLETIPVLCLLSLERNSNTWLSTFTNSRYRELFLYCSWSAAARSFTGLGSDTFPREVGKSWDCVEHQLGAHKWYYTTSWYITLWFTTWLKWASWLIHRLIKKLIKRWCTLHKRQSKYIVMCYTTKFTTLVADWLHHDVEKLSFSSVKRNSRD